jgi:DNA-directed RNA polymerase subunit RPC12/RpoP
MSLTKDFLRSRQYCSFKETIMTKEIECMCMECGISNCLPEDDIALEDPSAVDSKIIDSLLVCEQCGGRLMLVGKAGDEPFYCLK